MVLKKVAERMRWSQKLADTYKMLNIGMVMPLNEEIFIIILPN
jgi:hypothetical protein